MKSVNEQKLAVWIFWFHGVVGILKDDWLQTLWLVWFIWFVAFIPDKHNSQENKE